jgi:hypothetical protein
MEGTVYQEATAAVCWMGYRTMAGRLRTDRFG